MCSGGGKASAQAAGRARDAEEERQRKLDSGMKSINDAFGTSKGFTPEFYDKKAKDYSAYYGPQVDQQYKDAREQLLFGLQRAGLVRSSAGAKSFGVLDREKGTRETEIASNAADYAQQVRKQVEAAKSGVIAQLYATTNPQAAASAATNAANLVATGGNKFSPVGDLFGQVAGLAATSNTAQAYGGPGLAGFSQLNGIANRGYTGTAISGPGSAKVIG